MYVEGKDRKADYVSEFNNDIVFGEIVKLKKSYLQSVIGADIDHPHVSFNANFNEGYYVVIGFPNSSCDIFFLKHIISLDNEWDSYDDCDETVIPYCINVNDKKSCQTFPQSTVETIKEFYNIWYGA
jgi:hypothetical protein